MMGSLQRFFCPQLPIGIGLFWAWNFTSWAGVAEVEQLRATITEWVEVEKTISKERETFRSHQEELELRTSLVQSEINSQQEALVELEKKKVELSKQKHELEQWSHSNVEEQGEFLKTLVGMEQNLLSLKPKLPPHLAQQLESHYVQLQKNTLREAANHLTDRLQLTTTIVAEIDTFSQKAHWVIETLDLGEGLQDVKVLYVGCARAFYMTPLGKEAGVGWPGEKGWLWKARPEDKNRIIQAFREGENPKSISELYVLPVLRLAP